MQKRVFQVRGGKKTKNKKQLKPVAGKQVPYHELKRTHLF